MNDRLTITEVAEAIGITPRTIMRWEKSGKIKKSKRDWRGWRFYYKEDIEEIKQFYEGAYDYDTQEDSGVSVNGIVKNLLIVVLALTTVMATSFVSMPLYADPSSTIEQGPSDTVDVVLDELPTIESVASPVTEAVKYTLGPDDVVSIAVARHPEFSGKYSVNSEGKIEYKHIGDIIVNGLTKTELKDRLTEILSVYIIEPDVDIQIVAYLSKVFYVIGEVHKPGKFFMRGDEITVREALVQSGLPTYAAAMRKCRLIKPDESGDNNYEFVNVYSLLYKGNLKENLIMEPGDVLYIPATIAAKTLRIISPATSVAGQATNAVSKGAVLGGF